MFRRLDHVLGFRRYSLQTSQHCFCADYFWNNMRRMASTNVEFFAANGDIRTNTSAAGAFQLYDFTQGMLPAAPAPSRTTSPGPKSGQASGSVLSPGRAEHGDEAASPPSPGTTKRNQLLLEMGE